jgi:hypothetical protein
MSSGSRWASAAWTPSRASFAPAAARPARPITEAFLEFTRARGNDLSTPVPEAGFPGLAPGDRWCLCARRWAEAAAAGVAPPVILGATHERALDEVSLEDLKKHALDLV